MQYWTESQLDEIRNLQGFIDWLEEEKNIPIVDLWQEYQSINSDDDDCTLDQVPADINMI